MTANQGLSLSDLDASTAGETGHEFEYIKPDGSSSGVFLTVLGSQSATVKARVAALLNERRRQEIAAAAEAKSAGRTGDAFVPVETDITFGQKLAAARLTGWRGIREEFTSELGLKLCQTNQDVASQVIAQSDRVGNFLKVLTKDLVAYAEAQFRLSATVGKGKLKASRRVHLEALAAGGDDDAAAELASVPDLPPLAAHVWGYFVDLAQGRQSNGMALSRITRLEIRCWERDEMITLEPWERAAILQIDSAYLVQSSEPEEQREEA